MAEEGDAPESLVTAADGAAEMDAEVVPASDETTSPETRTSESVAEDNVGGLLVCPSPVDEPKEEVPEGTLSFDQHLWERFEFLWHSRVEPSQKLLEQVAAMLRARVELERQYATRLGQIGSQVTLDDELVAGNHSMCTAVDALVVNFRNRGEQSVALADQVEQDIILTLEEVVAQHREVSRKMRSDIELLTRYCADTRKSYAKAAQRYGNRCLEAETVAQECLQGLAAKATERTKTGQRVVTLSMQARQAEVEYYNAIIQANKAVELYEAHLPTVLNKLQEMEEKRHLCLRDGLRKMAVYEVSWLRNMQYDIEATAKSSEDADPEKDLQTFLRDNWKAKGKRPPVEPASSKPVFLASSYWQLGRVKPPKETEERRQLFKDDKVIRQCIAEFQPLMKQIISGEGATPAVSSGAPAESATPAPLDVLRSGLMDPRRRAALSQVLRGEIMAVQEQTNIELDNAKPVIVPAAALECIASIFDAGLNSCDDHADPWSGRELMVMADKFKAEVEAGKTLSLLTRIYSHRIWSKVTFWEDVLQVGLCEAHAAEVIWRRSLSPGSRFDQPAMTAFLHRFVAHMLNFGIRLEQARNAVVATLRKQSLVLGANTKKYETLILQAYESGQGVNDVATKPPEAGVVPNDDSAGVVSADTAPETAGDAKQPAVQADEEDEDDFESMALGLPAAAAQ